LVEAFRDLPAEHLAELERLLITQAVSRGEVLMRQGDAADALYLVASGRFAVNVDGRRIAEVGSGSPIGEIGFFADGIRTATVTALRDSIVLKLPKREFAAFAERHPIILKPIAVTLARRLADTLAGDEQSLTHPRTLAVIGAGGFAVPNAFRKRLALALSCFGQIATVDSATLAAALSGNVDLDSEAVTSWFNRQEFRYHYVLYFADAELTPFSAKIIRQADQLLIVGDATEGAPEPSPLERFALDIHPGSQPAGSCCSIPPESRSPARRAGSTRGPSPCITTSSPTIVPDMTGLPASSAASREASSPAAEARCAPPMSASTRHSSRRISASTCSAARAAAAPWPRPSPWARAPTRSAPAPPRFFWRRARSSD
jgi:hypothetical protein